MESKSGVCTKNTYVKSAKNRDEILVPGVGRWADWESRLQRYLSELYFNQSPCFYCVTWNRKFQNICGLQVCCFMMYFLWHQEADGVLCSLVVDSRKNNGLVMSIGTIVIWEIWLWLYHVLKYICLSALLIGTGRFCLCAVNYLDCYPAGVDDLNWVDISSNGTKRKPSRNFILRCGEHGRDLSKCIWTTCIYSMAFV